MFYPDMSSTNIFHCFHFFPIFVDLLDDLDWFKQRNIGVINASPLALGLLNNDANWPEWHIAPKITKDVCKKAAQFCKDNDADLGTFFRLLLHFCYFLSAEEKEHSNLDITNLDIVNKTQLPF